MVEMIVTIVELCEGSVLPPIGLSGSVPPPAIGFDIPKGLIINNINNIDVIFVSLLTFIHQKIFWLNNSLGLFKISE